MLSAVANEPSSRHRHLLIAMAVLLANASPGVRAGTIDVIEVSPAWIDYGGEAVAKFWFSPECLDIKVYKVGDDSGCCHFGHGCWMSPPSSLQMISTSHLTAANLTELNNGNYYAVCADNKSHIEVYTNNVTIGRHKWNLAVGVKPAIFSIDFHQANTTERSLLSNVDTFGDPHFTAIAHLNRDQVSSESQLVFKVGRGHNPRSLADDEDFAFIVPEFEAANVDFGYSFVKFVDFEAYTPFRDYPEGFMFRYAFKPIEAITLGHCDLQGTAVAVLGNEQVQQTSFQLSLILPPVVNDISVNKVDTGCLFTCHYLACPENAEAITFEWSIYSRSWGENRTMEKQRSKHAQILVAAHECAALLSDLSSPFFTGNFYVSCRAITESLVSSELSLPLIPLMDSIFESTPLKVSLIEKFGQVCDYSPYNCLDIYSSSISNAQMECDENECVFGCKPKCGNPFCVEQYC